MTGMGMAAIKDHPLRYQLSNELHARPFPTLNAPCHAIYLAIKQPEQAAARDRDLDRAHLLALLDRHGAPHPQPGATHYSGTLGRYGLKWENHTEFVTYTIFAPGLPARAFDPATFDVFPADWLAEAPGTCISSTLIQVEPTAGDDADLGARLLEWFDSSTLACSSVLDGSGVMASDFRIDPGGHMRFALFVRPEVGPARVGRMVQRLTEIEIYKTMSMLGLPRAHDLSVRMGEIDQRLTALTQDMASDAHAPEETLDALLQIAATLENMQTRASFRFSATAAYEALVHQRIEVMREQRFAGRQTFREFMMRRFDPSMRTVRATEARLRTMTDRATRAGELLRTKVDVARSAQNQKLLESMDRRADLQLRLQETVEGLSVVAISYYAVSLASYLAYPLAGALGVGKGMLSAALTLPVVLVVWWMIRRIRRAVH